ncbi:MAG: L,D-transpeptidase family protein [Shimia sp.]
MTRFARWLVPLVLVLVLSGCASKFRTYDGPEVTQVIVWKGQRQMALMHHGTILEMVPFELGFAPVGPKQIRGDGRTPEGLYYIDRRNPNSKFHLSLGISYPNAEDTARAEAAGFSPGGDIFIHGTPRKFRRKDDWTWGCLAVDNRTMEDLYAMIRVGTPIDIRP